MKNKMPSIVLAAICIVLTVMLLNANQEIGRLKLQLDIAQTGDSAPKPIIAKTETPSLITEPEKTTDPISAAEEPTNAIRATEDESTLKNQQRIMSGVAQMMENPTMNKMMEASQRGAIGALYSDMIEYLDLDADQTNYFMDLLMYRQMKQVDVGMKMMGGNMSEEEKKALTEELKEADKTVKAEMESFLNSPTDFEEFKFYEKTMGERMMLSSMDQKLASSDVALSDDAYRGLLDMMHEEKKSYDFSSDLHDEKNTDLSAERFSKENLKNYGDDMDNLNSIMIQKAQSMLSPEQLEAYIAAIKSTSEMQKAQLEMAGQMFGGGK